jgi:quercetin dioxygenase-like cupin family protein
VASRFEDDRGVIEDLLVTPLDAVARIRSVKGAIRGNHVHYETTQWTYIVSGMLRITTRAPGENLRTRVYFPGEMAREDPGVAHAWEALEDTVVLVFTKGPRSGEAYEEDTHRLTGADRLIAP